MNKVLFEEVFVLKRSQKYKTCEWLLLEAKDTSVVRVSKVVGVIKVLGLLLTFQASW